MPNHPALAPEVNDQLAQACAVLRRHLGAAVVAVHLYGSALNGGLRPTSDLDLLVMLETAPTEGARRAVLQALLEVSAPPGEGRGRRALEVTAVARGEVCPWRYPARREFQFGEWLRGELQAGRFEAPGPDIDLTLLLAQALEQSLALVGPAAKTLFEPIPPGHFFRALAETLPLWSHPADWAGDERNVVLTLARIWHSAATAKLIPKDTAADSLLPHLPPVHRPLLEEARDAYREGRPARLPPAATAAFILYAREAAARLLAPRLAG